MDFHKNLKNKCKMKLCINSSSVCNQFCNCKFPYEIRIDLIKIRYVEISKHSFLLSFRNNETESTFDLMLFFCS